MTTILFYVLLTLGISSLFTMLGLGGGLVLSPFFILSGISLPLAVSTSLLINGAATLSASVAYMQKKMIRFKVALPLLVGSVLGAPWGARLTADLNLRFVLAVLTLAMLFGAYRMAFSHPQVDEDRSDRLGNLRIFAGGVGIGVGVGIVGAMVGIGGGIFMMPVLMLVMHVSTRNAAAASTLLSAALSGSGFLTHLALGNYQLGFTLPMAAAGILGGQIGSRFMIRKISGRTIRRMFAALLLLMSIQLIYRIWIR